MKTRKQECDFGARIDLWKSLGRSRLLSVLNYRTVFNFYLFSEALNYMCFGEPQGRSLVNYENTLQDYGLHYQGGVPSELKFLC